MPPRQEKLVEFLESVYEFDSKDEPWLVQVTRAAGGVFGEGPAHALIYDASDPAAFRVPYLHVSGFDARGEAMVRSGPNFITPSMVARTYRLLLVGGTRALSQQEMSPLLDALEPCGIRDALNLNTLDPSGFGASISLWCSTDFSPSKSEEALYRRMAHHLTAAYRCRRRLRAAESQLSRIDASVGSEAILDERDRVVHATGLAEPQGARRNLIEAARARRAVLTSRAETAEHLERWRPLTSARWTLVDSFESDGKRFVVARENQCQVLGLQQLSERERQVVAYLVLGQSTKEAAYALGIANATVRVLLARAARKLGVRSRAALLEHAEVRALRPLLP